jgi:LytS/YehU family sensor histidine kinase
MPIGYVVAWAGRFIVPFFPIAINRLRKTIAVQGVYALLSIGAWAVAFLIWGLLCSYFADKLVNIHTVYILMPFVAAAMMMLHITAMLIHYLILSAGEQRRIAEELLNQKLATAEAEVAMLRSTMHPHFLFNSLALLQSLIVKQPEKAAAALSDLTEFLLYSVQFTLKREVPLADEFSHAKHFANIETLREIAPVTFDFDCPLDCADLPVIPYILQPLVENALKHGVNQCKDGGTITVSASRDERSVIIEVANPREPVSISAKSAGSGLSTLARRLQMRYGGGGRLLIDKKETEWIARIIIPVVSKPIQGSREDSCRIQS